MSVFELHIYRVHTSYKRYHMYSLYPSLLISKKYVHQTFSDDERSLHLKLNTAFCDNYFIYIYKLFKTKGWVYKLLHCLLCNIIITNVLSGY